MALGNVFMTDSDGNIGNALPTSTDKVCGLLFDISGQSEFWTSGKGQEAAGKLKDTVVELNTYEDAEKLGIVKYTGTAEGNFLAGIPDFHINQYFSKAGGVGRLFVAFADCSNSWEVLLDMQRASGGIISQFGVWTEKLLWKEMDSSAAKYSIDLVADVNSVLEQMANDYYAPASCVLTANTSKVKTASGESKNVVVSKIPSCIVDARYVTVVLGQSMDIDVKKMQGSLASTTPVGVVGLLLGCLADASVGESFAWVQNFDLSSYVAGIEMGFGDSTVEDGVIKNATTYASLRKPQLDALDDAGYVFLRNYEGLEGKVYFTKDRTCSDKDYCSVSRNRTINKSRRLVRAALLPYVNSPVKVDPSTGYLSAGQIAEYTNLITDCLQAMEVAGEISAIGNVTVPSTQNVLKNKKLLFSYSLVPLGCAESIEVTEGLVVSR